MIETIENTVQLGVALILAIASLGDVPVLQCRLVVGFAIVVQHRLETDGLTLQVVQYNRDTCRE